MTYLIDELSWSKQLERWSDDQQKILIALSHERFRWRTPLGLLAATGLDEGRLEGAMAELVKAGVVRPSLSNDGRLIYGLVDRVGD